jgi:hypothetical protein
MTFYNLRRKLSSFTQPFPLRLNKPVTTTYPNFPRGALIGARDPELFKSHHDFPESSFQHSEFLQNFTYYVGLSHRRRPETKDSTCSDVLFYRSENIVLRIQEIFHQKKKFKKYCTAERSSFSFTVLPLET